MLLPPPARPAPAGRPARPRPHAAIVALAGVVAALAGADAAAQQAPAGAGPAATARVRGAVYDSLTRRALGGATVQLARTDDPSVGRATVADSAGGFVIDAVAPGRYLVGFLHPTLDLLNVEISPRVIDVGAGDAELRVDLAIPPLDRVRRAVCGADAPAGDSSGMLAGRVRDADDNAPPAGATVVVTWSELTLGAGGLRNERRRVPVATGPGGTYVLCGAPAGGGVVASAAAPGRASGLVEIDVPYRGLLVRDFALGDSLAFAAAPADPAARRPAGPADSTPAPRARGTARLAGTVRAPDGRPLRGARAFVWGTEGSATTDDRGAFALAGLPAGTRTLEVRAIGFEPRRVAVDLARGAAATADVRMAAAVPTLDRVVVMGKASRRTRLLDEFLERKRSNAFGRFVTAAEIEQRGPIAVTDALRMTPGVQVVPTGGFGNAILGRGGCTPAVVLDGMIIEDGAREIDRLVSPQQVAGIEVYAGAAGAPPQYAGVRAAGCGVVLLWTKR